MTRKDGPEGSLVRVPEPHRSVVAGGGDQRAVGTEGGAQDRTSVPAEDVNNAAAAGVPDPRSSVVAAGDDELAARVERSGADGAVVSTERLAEQGRKRDAQRVFGLARGRCLGGVDGEAERLRRVDVESRDRLAC